MLVVAFTGKCNNENDTLHNDAAKQLQPAATSLVKSVSLFAQNNSVPYGWIFVKFRIAVFTNICRSNIILFKI